jgi:hypothetical protein
MKKTTFLALLLTYSWLGVHAQLKIGKNPKNLLSNSMFQIETANGKSFIVDTSGKVGIGNTPAPIANIHITDNKASGIGPASNSQLVLTNKTSAPAIVFQNAIPADGVISMISDRKFRNGALIIGDFIMGGADGAKGFAIGGDLATANPYYNFMVTTQGNTGIGTTLPESKLEISGASGMLPGLIVSVEDSGLQHVLQFRSKVATGSVSDWKLYKGDSLKGYPSGLHLFSYPKNRTSFGGCCHTRMSWLDNGRVGINQVNPSNALDVWSTDSTWAQRITNTSTINGLGLLIDVQNITNGNALLAFNRLPSNNIGSVTFNGTGVSYNTTSDIRLKENLKNTRFSIEDLLKIRVLDYFYKSDLEHKYPSTGFIAQELYEIYPTAVTKGGEDEKTSPWSVDYSKLTPLLVKSLQDFKKEFNEKQEELTKAKDEIKSLKTQIELISKSIEEIKKQLKK